MSTLARLVEATGARLHLELRVPAGVKPGAGGFRRRAGAGSSVSSACILQAAARHGASDLRLFGSTARGEDRPDSDIDLVVHLGPGVGLFGLARLRRDLEELLGAPVDVVPDDGFKPEVRAAVERDPVAL